MKWFYWTLIFLVFFTPIVYIGKGIDHLDIMKDRYKRALDAGASAAARAIIYKDEESLEKASMGFGAKDMHPNNIAVDKTYALEWFYRVLFRNLGLQYDEDAQNLIKRYIPMKAVVGFDRLMIADAKDNWVIEERYVINHKGIMYSFTLSDQVLNMSTSSWGRDVDFGIEPHERQRLVNLFIKDKLDEFLNSRENNDSNYIYAVNISLNENDMKTEDINGISFIAMAEGMPLPTLNPWKTEKFYAFSLGGTEISR